MWPGPGGILRHQARRVLKIRTQTKKQTKSRTCLDVKILCIAKQLSVCCVTRSVAKEFAVLGKVVYCIKIQLGKHCISPEAKALDTVHLGYFLLSTILAYLA